MSKGWHRAGDGGQRRWRVIRDAVLDRNREENGGQCTLAIEGTCTVLATCVHHTMGRDVTGDDPRYLVASCKACNERVGSPMRQPDPPARPVSRW